MNATSCVLAVFSPTGGTEKIAQAVGKGTGLSVRTVDLSRDLEPCTVSAGELLVAACPVFGGRIPAVAGAGGDLVAALLGVCDGVLLPGGADFSPTLYGQTPLRKCCFVGWWRAPGKGAEKQRHWLNRIIDFLPDESLV